MQFRIHWLSLTIYGKLQHGLALWDVWFAPYLGAMQPCGHGARGFRLLYQSLGGAKLYGHPVTVGEGDLEDGYFHIELPGGACDALSHVLLREFLMELQRHEKFKVARLDLAWDGVAFTPAQVERAIHAGDIRTLAKRRTMAFTLSAWEHKDNGELGTSSLKLGSRHSSRMLRTYDKRGPVRLEFQARHQRAHAIALDVLTQPIEDWPALAVAHLRDYIDFVDQHTGQLLPWWGEFIGEVARARKTVSDARQLELQRMVEWIDKQVSCSLSVLHDVYGEGIIKLLVTHGRKKRGKRYDALLELIPGGRD